MKKKDICIELKSSIDTNPKLNVKMKIGAKFKFCLYIWD